MLLTSTTGSLLERTVSSYLRRPIVAHVWLGQTMLLPHYLNQLPLPDPVHWTDLICLSVSNYWFYVRDVQLQIQLFALFTSLPFNPRVYSLFFPDWTGFFKTGLWICIFPCRPILMQILIFCLYQLQIQSEYWIWKFLVCVVYVPLW